MAADSADREAWVKNQGSGLDPRTALARPDVAFEGLKGKVEAARFTKGRILTLSSPLADLKKGPRQSEGLLTQGLMGEQVRVIETHSGWAFCQLLTDGYVGYMEEKHLASHFPTPTHRVGVPLSHIYPVPDVKAPVRMALPFGARVCANPDEPREGFAEVKGQGWVYAKHLVPLGYRTRDFLSLAKKFLNSPYLWGGRSAMGLDCSAFLQLVLMAAGLSTPRDTDQQQKALGHSISNVPDPSLAKEGDLVFFPGHVGFVVADNRLLHANATRMMVSIDGIDEVAGWVTKQGGEGIVDIRRVKLPA